MQLQVPLLWPLAAGMVLAFVEARAGLDAFTAGGKASLPRGAAELRGAPRLLEGADDITCPGQINVQGLGNVTLVNAFWNVPGDPAGMVGVTEDGKITPFMKGRTYWADACVPTGYSMAYDHKSYTALPLLGRRLRYTTDLSGAGCGCNGALYLTSLQQNAVVSGCSDFYCDANHVCGVSCAEIDLQEANMYAWHSTLHVLDDGSGIAAGYGGGGDNWNGQRDWTSSEYGPHGGCISTLLPFQVSVSFPVSSTGRLEAMDVLLSQQGRPCNLTVSLRNYAFAGRDAMEELSRTLAAGMTPIVSYWSAKNMLWMDGRGADRLGPCEEDLPDLCSAKVDFYDFSVEDIKP